jgi:hypothetical protein
MDGVVVRDCSAAGATFDDINLAGSSFVNVNLHGATFTDVNLSGVRIEDANIAGLSIFGHDIAALIRGAPSPLRDYLLLMHDDCPASDTPKDWPRYFAMLRARGAFQGGSTIGAGDVIRKDGAALPTTERLAGYIRIRAKDMAEARSLIAGNPVFECGGSVEIRELPRD